MGQNDRKIKTLLSLNLQEDVPVGRQIIDKIKAKIKSGELVKDTFLPSSRDLATQLKVNRKTVSAAYEYLIDTGWLISVPRSGIYVQYETHSSNTPSDQLNIQTGYQFNIFQSNFREADIANKIVFNAGLPDPRLMPLDDLARVYRRLFQQKSRWRMMGYNDEKGAIKLREELAIMLLSNRNIVVSPDNICITRGSQMAIYLLAQVLLKKGEIVVVENPGFMSAWEVFANSGAIVTPVPVYEDGISVEHVEQLCKTSPVKVVYITPQHQYPTTVVLKAGRRSKLIQLASVYGFVIIEDDYDNEYHFKTQTIAPMASECHKNIIYISSFSKLISPAIRVGYIVAPAAVINSVAALRVIIDRQGDVIMENALAELLYEGVIKKHTRKAYNVYKKRRQFMSEMLNQYLSDKITYKMPEGGLAYWVRLNHVTNTNIFANELLKNNVQIIASEKFDFSLNSINAMRLGFASLDESETELGIKTIAKTLAKFTK